MAKTIQQAEAELKTAALEYVSANKAYMVACDTEAERVGGYKVFSETPYDKHGPDWQAACRLANTKQHDLCEAAKSLAEAVNAERRAEAL